MSFVRDVSEDTDSAVAMSDTPEGLFEIRRPGCAAAIWRRQPLSSFQSWIDALEPDELPRARVILRPADIQEVVRKICDSSGTPDGPERRRLIEDTAALAQIFAGLMDAKYLRLRLDVVTTNACRKFHIDAVTARLVCTYRGPGTQYGISSDGAEPHHIITVPTGAPILLRGTRWPVHPCSGLLHRSPPIEGTGITRAALVLDPVDNPEDEV